jgi:hypothetical protein
LPPATRKPFNIETFEPTFPPERAIEECVPDDEPDLDWFHRSRNPSNPDPDGYDQSQTWQDPKSSWTTAASWFLNPPDPSGGLKKMKKILAKR